MRRDFSEETRWSAEAVSLKSGKAPLITDRSSLVHTNSTLIPPHPIGLDMTSIMEGESFDSLWFFIFSAFKLKEKYDPTSMNVDIGMALLHRKAHKVGEIDPEQPRSPCPCCNLPTVLLPSSLLIDLISLAQKWSQLVFLFTFRAIG